MAAEGTIFGVPFQQTVNATEDRIQIHPIIFGQLLNSIPRGTKIFLFGKREETGKETSNV